MKSTYRIPRKPRITSEAIPEMIFKRLTPFDTCRKMLGETVLNEVADLAVASPEEKQIVYEQVALGLTNCHLVNHGRDESYNSQLEMPSHVFSIYTQFLLAVEAIVREMDHEKWQVSTEVLITELFHSSKTSLDTIMKVHTMSTSFQKRMTTLMKMQRRLKLQMTRQNKSLEVFFVKNKATYEETLSNLNQLSFMSQTTIEIITRQSEESLNASSKAAAELEAKFEYFDNKLQRATNDLSNTIVKYYTYIEILTKEKQSYFQIARNLLQYVIWLQFLRWVQAPHILRYIYGFAIMSDMVAVFTAFNSYAEHAKLIGIGASLLIGLSLTLFNGWRFNRNFTMEEKDTFMTDLLIDQIVQIRLQYPSIQLNPKLVSMLECPPTNYEILENETLMAIE